MTQLTLPQAAKATGKDRSTLFRAIKSGKLTATKNAAGDYVVDVAELDRVYPVKSPRTHTGAVRDVASQLAAPAESDRKINELVAEVGALRAQIAALEADKRSLNEDKSDIRAERDHWRKAYDDQTATVKLLTDQRQVKIEPTTKPKGILARLFGG